MHRETAAIFNVQSLKRMLILRKKVRSKNLGNTPKFAPSVSRPSMQPRYSLTRPFLMIEDGDILCPNVKRMLLCNASKIAFAHMKRQKELRPFLLGSESWK